MRWQNHVATTIIDLDRNWTAEWHILHLRFAAYGAHETTGRNTRLPDKMYDGNGLSRSSERITIWVRVKGKLAEGSPSHFSANCAPCRWGTLETDGGPPMANTSKTHLSRHLPLGKHGLRIPKDSSKTIVEVNNVTRL